MIQQKVTYKRPGGIFADGYAAEVREVEVRMGRERTNSTTYVKVSRANGEWVALVVEAGPVERTDFAVSAQRRDDAVLTAYSAWKRWGKVAA